MFRIFSVDWSSTRIMKKQLIASVLAFAIYLLLSSAVFAQTQIPPGWKTCPHCLTPEQQQQEARFNPRGMPFNPRDLSGVWNSRPEGIGDFESRGTIIETQHNVFAKNLPPSGIPPKVPPLTPYRKQLFDATRTEFAPPPGTRVTNSRDPMLKCDPLGWPRWFTYNYGFEFVMLPDRVLQFIEWGHTWRTIWTDGRKLPENPPELRFNGWAVGHWEPDNTFVVESTGYDDRSWLSEAGNFVTSLGDGSAGLNCWPHSDEMKIVERWKRTSFGILEAQVTVIDPKVYQEPWAADVVKHTLLPDTEIWEYFCVPSDSDVFNQI